MTFKLRSEELEWKQIDDEIVALDARRAEYLSIEGSGTSLWHALLTGATRSELVDSLIARYGIDEERAGADVDVFVADLAAKGLLAG